MHYTFKNVLGTFTLDEKLNIVDKKVKDAKPLPEDKIPKVLELFKDKKYFKKFYEENLKLTKKSIKSSVTEDQLIMQAISNINELDKTSNLLSKRLREWYGLYFPEFSEQLSSHEKFVELAATKTRKELIKEFDIKDSMGADLGDLHVDEMILLAKEIMSLYSLRKKHEDYLQKVMKKYSPNLLELAGATIGAKLIELAKGLKRLAMLPASTVQLLGAEKALFRHIKTGSRSPKYGVIINHPIIQNAKKDEKGKAARVLADKLSLCARLDFFKGEFKAPEYKKELEEKFL